MSLHTRFPIVISLVAWLFWSGLAPERTVSAQGTSPPSPAVQRALELAEQSDLIVARVFIDGAIVQSTGAAEKADLTATLGLLRAKALLAEREFAGALRDSRAALAQTENGPVRAALLGAQSTAYERVGERRLANGALIMAAVFHNEDRRAKAYMDAMCAAQRPADPTTSESFEVLRQRFMRIRACVKDELDAVTAYAEAYRAQTTAPPTKADFQLVTFGGLIEPIFVGLVDVLMQTLEAPELDSAITSGVMLGRMISRIVEGVAATDAAYGGVEQSFGVQELVLSTRNALVSVAADRWRDLSSLLPRMSDQQRRGLMALAAPGDVEKAVSLTFVLSGANPAGGFRTALLTKQLLFDTSRHANTRMQEALNAASPEWSERWQAKERMRQRYAEQYVYALRESDAGSTRAEGGGAREADLIALSRQIDALEGELRKTNAIYAEQAPLGEVTVEQVTGALRPGEALVEYVTYEPFGAPAGTSARQFGAFVVRGGTGEISAIPLGDAARVADEVRRIRESMRRAVDMFVVRRDSRQRERTPRAGELSASEHEFGERSAELRTQVWTPLEKALAGARRVYVAPVAELSLIPFETLAAKTQNGWRYLVEDREIVYLGTGRDLARLTMNPLRTRRGAGRTAVLIGDPRFSASSQEIANAARTKLGPERFRSLATPGSSLLGTTPAAVLPTRLPSTFSDEPGLQAFIDGTDALLHRLGWTSASYTGALASEPVALSVASPDLLQFLTHGIALSQEPAALEWDNPLLRSMLILAGANARAPGEATGDGILTAYEVAGMNLHGTRLVNLTACDTGLGDVTPEGVAGLRQAFLLAGARAVTVSLWPLPTARTITQMNRFYTLWLGRGQMPYVALRQAQRESLAEARNRYGSGHPFHWAGVVFLGDPGDLRPLPTRP